MNAAVRRPVFQFWVCTLVVATISSGCTGLNNKTKTGAIGAGTGAVIGGIIGNNTGSTARGAIIGAAVGGAAGVIIGNQMDQQAKELKTVIPGAVVERVGEGINVTFPSGLLYDFDSEIVKSGAANSLTELAESLQRYPETELLITGYTDTQGTSAYNQALSLRRADAAAQFLIARNVPASRLRTIGRGEMDPIASNDTESGRQQNRRTEITIVANEKARQRSTP